MAAKYNPEGILMFEQPFAKVPFENYRKTFRTSQRNIERDFVPIQTASKDLLTKAKNKSLNAQDAVKAIDGMISKVENLKHKLSDLYDSSTKTTQDTMRERLQHLSTMESLTSATSPEWARWADTRLDRWLVDWCLRNGKDSTAKLIAEQKGIERLVDIGLFMDIQRIEDAIIRHSCSEALVWCSENKNALRKMKSTLEFDLRLQEYIELSRMRKLKEAIAYSKKYLLPWRETHLAQVQQACALLAFQPNTSCGPYKRLYDPSRWYNLVRVFRSAVYTLNTLPIDPLLHLALYAGLASLKLPACYGHDTKNVDCPVCDGEVKVGGRQLGMGRLAEEVPFSHHANSTIVCRISGKIMDADNMPMAFPNGQVYSREVLEEMAAKNNDIVTCPRTGTTCPFSALRKVFIS